MPARSDADFREPILLLDPQLDRAVELAENLKLVGFSTCVETSIFGALAAIDRIYFASLVVVADIDQPANLDWLNELRRNAPRSWLMVVSPWCDTTACDLIHRHGGDACIAAPVSIHELAARLKAFQLRSRPAP